jgi:hypothetical protein
VASHPAQAQHAGPAQVKVYKTTCSDKILQHNEFTYIQNGHEGKMFHQCLACDVNLRGTVFMIRAFFSITIVVAAISRVLFVRPAGRRLRKRILEMQHLFLASLLQLTK